MPCLHVMMNVTFECLFYHIKNSLSLIIKHLMLHCAVYVTWKSRIEWWDLLLYTLLFFALMWITVLLCYYILSRLRFDRQSQSHIFLGGIFILPAAQQYFLLSGDLFTEIKKRYKKVQSQPVSQWVKPG